MNYREDIDIKELMNASWLKHISDDIIEEVNLLLRQDKEKYREDFYPYKESDIFKIFNICNLEDVKVVILGQDPYYASKNQANGIAFSVNEGEKIPPSLRNIYKEANIDIKNGDLIKWVKQGVFMLNASLTVRAQKPNSHEKIWKKFVVEVIEVINRECSGVIFISWGNFALERYKTIDISKHNILSCSHPSPLSCYKTDKPFMGSGIFKKINEILISRGDREIEWALN